MYLYVLVDYYNSKYRGGLTGSVVINWEKEQHSISKYNLTTFFGGFLVYLKYGN